MSSPEKEFVASVSTGGVHVERSSRIAAAKAPIGRKAGHASRRTVRLELGIDQDTGTAHRAKARVPVGAETSAYDRVFVLSILARGGRDDRNTKALGNPRRRRRWIQPSRRRRRGPHPCASAGAAQRSDRPDHRGSPWPSGQTHWRRRSGRISQRRRRGALRRRNPGGMVKRNAGVPADRRIEFRIGIHLGDVVEESDGDLMGDGVNIAARLESIASRHDLPVGGRLSPGQRRLDLAVTDLGPTQLNNIAGRSGSFRFKSARRQRRSPRRSRHPKYLPRRASRSSSCRSPILAAARSRSTSPMGHGEPDD